MSSTARRIFVSVLALSLAMFAVNSFAQVSSTFSSQLCAGQTNDVGSVDVWNDGTNVYVKFLITEPGWVLALTHAHVATSPAGIPQSKSKNPIPGQFAQQTPHAPGVLEFTHSFPHNNAPTLYVGAHAEVVEISGESIPAPYPADFVVTSVQGLRKDGTPVLPERSDPLKALAYGDGFFSMGFGGSLTVEFSCPIVDGPGNDLLIVERTDGVYPPERVDVFASNDNVNFTLIGQASNGRVLPSSGSIFSETNDSIDFATSGVTSARYIKLVDVSDAGIFESSADAFDVEAIKSEQACLVEGEGEETAWGGACGTPLGTRFTPKGNWGTYITYAVSLP